MLTYLFVKYLRDTNTNCYVEHDVQNDVVILHDAGRTLYTYKLVTEYPATWPNKVDFIVVYDAYRVSIFSRDGHITEQLLAPDAVPNFTTY